MRICVEHLNINTCETLPLPCAQQKLMWTFFLLRFHFSLLKNDINMQLHIRGNQSHVLDVEQHETVAEIKVIIDWIPIRSHF